MLHQGPEPEEADVLVARRPRIGGAQRGHPPQVAVAGAGPRRAHHPPGAPVPVLDQGPMIDAGRDVDRGIADRPGAGGGLRGHPGQHAVQRADAGAGHHGPPRTVPPLDQGAEITVVTVVPDGPGAGGRPGRHLHQRVVPVPGPVGAGHDAPAGAGPGSKRCRGQRAGRHRGTAEHTARQAKRDPRPARKTCRHTACSPWPPRRTPAIPNPAAAAAMDPGGRCLRHVRFSVLSGVFHGPRPATSCPSPTLASLGLSLAPW